MKPGESFIAQPVRSLQTMLRVISANDRRLPAIVPDGIYGEETVAAVAAFQRQNDLPVTGITDQATWEAIVKAYEDALIQVGKAQPIEIILEPGQVFRRGDNNPYLYLLQAMLFYLSTLHTSIPQPSQNGILDDPTSQALAGFQKLAGLPATGEMDRNTWRYLVHQYTLNANR